MSTFKKQFPTFRVLYLIKTSEEKITPESGRKIAADIYIDDRNLGGLPDWGVIYSIIKGKTTPTYNMEYAHPKSKGFVNKIRNLFY